MVVGGGGGIVFHIFSLNFFSLHLDKGIKK